MDFIVSKLLWIVVSPVNFLVLLLAIGVCLHGCGRHLIQRIGWRMTVLATVVLAGLLILPLDLWVIQPLEERFPVPKLPAHVDGIIVLGGMVDTVVSQAWGQPKLNHNADRLTEFVHLARLYPEAKLIFSGGSGALLSSDLITEAAVAREICARLGLATDRIQFEDRSRNTYENVLFSLTMAQPKKGETWVLITSAIHMPRAVGIFRQMGWSVLPYPVAFWTAPPVNDLRPPLSLANTFFRLDEGTHEWVGLLAYHMMGRTSEWFPGP